MSAVISRSPSTSAWVPALATLALVWVVLGLAYADTVAAMVNIWMN